MNIGISARNLYIDGKKKKFINETYLSFLKEFNLTPILIHFHLPFNRAVCYNERYTNTEE